MSRFLVQVSMGLAVFSVPSQGGFVPDFSVPDFSVPDFSVPDVVNIAGDIAGSAGDLAGDLAGRAGDLAGNLAGTIIDLASVVYSELSESDIMAFTKDQWKTISTIDLGKLSSVQVAAIPPKMMVDMTSEQIATIDRFLTDEQREVLQQADLLSSTPFAKVTGVTVFVVMATLVGW